MGVSEKSQISKNMLLDSFLNMWNDRITQITFIFPWFEDLGLLTLFSNGKSVEEINIFLIYIIKCRVEIKGLGADILL